MTLRDRLEELYAFYNRRECAHPDPVEFLYRYDRVEDREIVGLVASCLAYGRVAYILKSAEAVLSRLTKTPAAFLDASSPRDMVLLLRGIQHRWTTADQLAALLLGARSMRAEVGSLEAGFMAALDPAHDTVLPALEIWVSRMRRGAGTWATSKSLLSDPGCGSACKRLHLFLRWMVREDAVDPGGWRSVSPSKLLVPLDVHMHRVSRLLRLTRRHQADGAAALEVTRAFARISPDDPVKYDFALTRFGIREGMTADGVRAEIRRWGRLTR
jgi:uncharacterized protein (TIGR02757 family)